MRNPCFIQTLPITLCALLLFSTPSFPANTFIVDLLGGGHFSAIQDCIDDPLVLDGDTCLVNPGTYFESIDFSGKNIVLRSSQGPDVTVIDGSYLAPVVYFVGGETPNATIEGFKIIHGYGAGVRFPTEGGGIHCENSSPTIRACIIAGNISESASGICCLGSSPSITDCFIHSNSGSYGGIYCGGGEVTIRNCTISSNQAILDGGGIYCWSPSVVVENCVISQNGAEFGGGICNYGSLWIMSSLVCGNGARYGGGVIGEGDNTVVINCTIVENGAGQGGGFVCGPDALITNSIVWGNFADEGAEILAEFGSPSVTYSAVKGGWPGIGNIDEDPLLVGGGDYHLTEGSPSLDAGDNSASGPPSMDLDGNARVADGNCDGSPVVDMGAYEFAKICAGPCAATAEASTSFVNPVHGSADLLGLGFLVTGVILLMKICSRRG